MRNHITLLAVALSAGLHGQTTHELLAIDFQFLPDTVHAVQGDSLRIIFSSTEHTFTQVSETTWNANGNTPIGLYNFGPGLPGVTFVLDGSGTIHYVCAPHASMGMKGIVDISLVGIGEDPLLVNDAFYPNPARDQLWLRQAPPDAAFASFFDATGREVHRASLRGNLPLSVDHLDPGLYNVRVLDPKDREILRQQVVVQ